MTSRALGCAQRFSGVFQKDTLMLNYKQIGRLPESITISRNGKPLSALRVNLGKVRVIDRTLKIADAEMIDEFPPLPVTITNGEYDVYTYQWPHPRGIVNLCAVLYVRPQRWSLTRRLSIPNEVRPDLAEGLIVDFGAVSIKSGNAITLTSGLGDGYYPVFANNNFGWWLQSLIVDFKIWEMGNVVHMPGQQVDEYGIGMGG